VGDRTQRFITEAGRFLAVGGLATAVALVIFNVLVHGLVLGTPPLGDQPVLAYVVANSVGMVVSYHGSRRWAFRDRPSHHADGGLTAFVVINLATMLIPIACLSISRDGLGLTDPLSDNISANVVGLMLGQAARFFLFRTLVFRRPIHLVEMYDDPADPWPLSASRDPADRSTETSTSDPAVPSGPEAAAG
jgi:putative flippase GtrA